MVIKSEYEAIIIGAGPAGLAAACVLRASGIHDILVIEREREAGGVPRHCGHRSFGWLEFGALLRGPDYAARLCGAAAGVPMLCGATVTALRPGGELEINIEAGVCRIAGKKVLLAMGARETPRSARLTGGSRPWGVMTTGALQQFVYLTKRSPCRRAVVVGSELVAYSALLTLRHAGAKVVAMIESSNRTTAFRALRSLPAVCMGTRLLTGARIARIVGQEGVSAVEVETPVGVEHIECDAVIFTGEFIPESALLRASHLDIDAATGGPLIDQYGRCSDPAYFAAGNLLRAVEPSWNAWREGGAVARCMAAALCGDLATATGFIDIHADSPLEYVCPQRLAIGASTAAAIALHLRSARSWRGLLHLQCGDRIIWSRRMRCGRYQMTRLPMTLASLQTTRPLSIVAREY